jgi:hypothetical protein
MGLRSGRLARSVPSSRFQVQGPGSCSRFAFPVREFQIRSPGACGAVRYVVAESDPRCVSLPTSIRTESHCGRVWSIRSPWFRSVSEPRLEKIPNQSNVQGAAEGRTYNAEPRTQTLNTNLDPGTWNLEPGTWNLEPAFTGPTAFSPTESGCIRPCASTHGSTSRSAARLSCRSTRTPHPGR